jgi:hypothetical protein
MLLPKQAEPVRVARTGTSERPDDKGALPQVTCVCKQGYIVCVVGRDIYNTQQPC